MAATARTSVTTAGHLASRALTFTLSPGTHRFDAGGLTTHMDSDIEQIDHHRRRIDRLIIAFWLVALVAGLVVGLVLWLLTPLGWLGLPVGIGAAAACAALLLRRSERWLVDSYGGTDVDAETHPRLINVVEGLCASSGVALPQLRIVDSPAVNLVAVGRHASRSWLIVTTGALDRASRIELEALVANEVSQVRTLDTAHASTVATTIGLPALVVDLGKRLRAGRSINGGGGSAGGRVAGMACLLFTPFAAVSRTRAAAKMEPHRDFRTDVTGVQLTRYPPGMIAALECVEAAPDATLEVAGAGAALWVVDPLASQARPPLAERIAALREL